MTPSARRQITTGYWLPVIVYPSGRKVTVYGPPLVNKETAMKYAALHIADINKGRMKA